MKVTVKFFSSLMEYLPPGTDDNTVELTGREALTPRQIIGRFSVPEAEVRTMMKNGTFLPEASRDIPLEDGDVLTVWPAMQGG